MSLSILILVLLAPLPYWLVGLPWVIGSRRLALAPLLGCVITGFACVLAMMASVPVKAASIVLIAGSAAALVARRRPLREVKAAFGEWLPFYGVSLFAASVSPFPVLGGWSGDWLLYYEMGQALLSGPLPASMLTRPPLFGAAATPLWWVHDGLAPYQVLAAVASAASLSATLEFLRFLRPNAPRLWLLPLIVSPFFLHNTAAAWPKFLAGAFVLQAALEAFRAARWASGVFFALAVATHEGFILWAPCILLCHVHDRFRWGELAKSALSMAFTGIVFVAPLLVWIALQYGIEAKVASNPSITDADAVPVPFYEKTIIGVLSAFVAWGTVENVQRWLGHAHPLDLAIVGKESYWFVTGWVTNLAGSLLGLLWPFLLLRKQFRSIQWSERVVWRTWWVTAGLPIAVLVNSAIAGFNSPHGALQSALSPLAFGAYALLAAHVFAQASDPARAIARVTWGTAIVGTLPWLVLNAAVTVGLALSQAVRDRMLNGSEGDYHRVLDNHLEPLARLGFPVVPLLAVALVIGPAVWMRRRDDDARPEPEGDLVAVSGKS